MSPCFGIRSLLTLVALLLLLTGGGGSALAQKASLSEAQRTALVDLVHKDAEAGALFADVQKNADAALTAEPNPIKTIRSEGLLASDPRKQRTRESLADLGKLDALGWAYALTRKETYAAKARAFLIAWADTNVPTGDPIDETNLEPAIVAYDLTKATFAERDRATVETWLWALAAREQESAKKGRTTAMNNWNSHRLKIVGLVGLALDDHPLIDAAVAGLKKQVEVNLRPDGSSFDFEERDALHYHVYDLEPLLSLAIALRASGEQTGLFRYEAPGGSSLAKSVDFLVPYCDGTKTHAEFVNSKVAFDKKRAQAGETGYASGTPFDPKQGQRTLMLASFFDPVRYESLALSLADKNPRMSRYPSWRYVVLVARRPAAKPV